MPHPPLPPHADETEPASQLAPRATADAVDAAIARLAITLERADDLDGDSRVLGASRRSVLTSLVGHLDRTTAALHAHRSRDGRAPADPRDARAIATGGPLALGTALGTRRGRLAEALEHALEHACPDDEADLVDELDALLARVELAHVALDHGYDLADLPPASVAACARVSAAFARLQSTLPPDPRIRPTARRRPGIASPRGRRSQ
ncbi:DinB family protein [Agrococcus jejuensis]|uniref:Uncharacterized protein n=1 Tax=Agrococcus jejuensis TaxID=399736 RepID=A0A1G8D1I5_9MICO|nr:hypothetical protein [Agrococcus jejuensis]SDH51030.1 hypothetical protein SAMN04489720_1468 [Agrococcus jejuensis]